MAYQNIGTYKIFDWEQEEIIDKQLIADPDTGVVEEVETLVQPYRHVWAELVVQQQVNASENRSDFKVELWGYGAAGYRGEAIELRVGAQASSIYLDGTLMNSGAANIKIPVGYGQTVSQLLASTNLTYRSSRYYLGYHELDGSFSYFVRAGRNVEPFAPIGKVDFTLGVNASLGVYENGVLVKSFSGVEVNNITPTALSNNRAVTPTSASNFTDEENPSFNYTVTTGLNAIPYQSSGSTKYSIERDRVTSLQAALSFDGETLDVGYRNIPMDGSNYTFNLTDAEKEVLRQKAQGSSTVPIYYLVKVIREIGDGTTIPIQSQQFVSSTQRNFTIVGAMPTLNPTVIDVNSDTIALTGNPRIFVRYESMVEFTTGAVASKHATIVSQSVQCGSKTIYNLYNGVIDDIESGSFIFNATDSRGLQADQVVITNTAMIEYVKPTCKQELKIEISGETGAAVVLKVSGNYFNGSFGAVNNTLLLQVRYKQGSGEYGAWTTIAGTPTFNDNKYELTTTFTGLNYAEAYTFQCRATDKLNFVETSSYTIKMLPIFDWSETDFNFNVPIQMNGETVLRHNETANNTVLSASGGKVYIRPNGSDTVGGEAIIYANGDASFNGGISCGGAIETMDSVIIGEYAINDYVIETGEEAMGTNGTWYWRKWASGKSEAWGCRNFGNAAVTTAWGNLYRSAIFTQDLPKKVFIRTPDSININIVHSNYGGWICKHEQTAPSATTTGSFIFVRPASATVSPTNIGFYIVGEWV